MRLISSQLVSFIVLSASSVVAHQDALFTSSISYCAPPEAILIQQFDISYIAANSSVVFNVTAASVVSNLSIAANIQLNVYGMNPVNITVDFCKQFGKVLCPLPTYNFSGQDSVPLPTGVDVASHVPGIAYRIPDLEAFAQVTLVDTDTGEVKACVQTTLSNGWSTRQNGVSWATASIALFALVLALYYTFANVESMALIRFLDTIHLFQHICLTGMLDLNYPVAYLSFALNFSWSFGLFGGSKRIQSAIDSLRAHTGGGNNPAVSPTSSVNRKLSPYNALFVGDSVPVTDPPTVLSAADALPAGIPTFTNSLSISQANGYLSIFFTLLIMIAIVIVGLTILRLGAKLRPQNFPTFSSIARSLILTTGILVLFPTLSFSFYQWTLHDSWLSIVLSVIVLLALLGVIGHAAFSLHRSSQAHGQPLPRNLKSLPPMGSLAQNKRWCFTILLAAFAKCLLIGFGQNNGTAQVVGILLIEMVVLSAVIIFRPNESRKSNLFTGFLAVARVVSIVLLIPFVTQLDVAAIPRVGIGLGIAVVFSIVTIALFLDAIFHAYQIIRDYRGSSEGTANLENAFWSDKPPTSSFVHLVNPGGIAQQGIDRSQQPPSNLSS